MVIFGWELTITVVFVREPVTTGMHGWEYLGGNWPPRGFPYGNRPPRECTGIFGWELATTGMHGNVGWEHPYRDVQCVLSRSSACHTKNTKPLSKIVVQFLICSGDYSRNLAAVKNQKTKADEIVSRLRLEKPMTRSVLDCLKTAGTRRISETKKTRLLATTHTAHAYRAKSHDAVPPVRYTIYLRQQPFSSYKTTKQYY